MENKFNISHTEENFHLLIKLVNDLQAEVLYLKNENATFKSQLNTDSHNSSKPPSSDGLKKIVNLRKPSKNPVGGQFGHKGNTLEFEGTPDRIIHHLPAQTCDCSLPNFEVSESISHEIDLPTVRPHITEHRQMHYHCTGCGKQFSSGVVQGHKVQYGSKIKSLSIYLKDYHFVPYQRLTKLFKDYFDLSISAGTLSNFTTKASEKLASFEEHLKKTLQNGSILHCDETGMRSEGKTQWMHVASNNSMTHYHFDSKRGKEAIERASILPQYKGTLIHDRFQSYFSYQSKHGLCNAHILRELIYLEEEGCEWAKEIKSILLKLKNKKDSQPTGRIAGKFLPRNVNKFKKIVRGELKKQHKASTSGCRGKPKRSKEHNLLIALNKHHRYILAFASDPDVPFDNNLAERDIRMVKTKQKVSGCFRNNKAGQDFARIRSFVSTMLKQNQNVLQELQNVFNELPIPMPTNS